MLDFVIDFRKAFQSAAYHSLACDIWNGTLIAAPNEPQRTTDLNKASEMMSKFDGWVLVTTNEGKKRKMKLTLSG